MRWTRVPRVPAWPRWAIALAAGWLGVLGLLELLAPRALPCGLRRLSGIPCPGCGLTRGLGALLRGDFARAFGHNPLLLAALLLLVALAAVRVAIGRAPRLRPGPGWILLALLLLAANWAYVVHTDRAVPARAARAG